MKQQATATMSRSALAVVLTMGIVVLPLTVNNAQGPDDATGNDAAETRTKDQGTTSPGSPPRLSLESRVVSHVYANSVSVDGRLATYTNWKTGKVMLRNLRTGEDKEVSPGGYPEYGMYARISPDAKRIAYAWRINRGRWDLRMFDLDASTETVLQQSEKGVTFYPIDWSPGGKEVLVTSDKTLALVSVDDGSKRDIYVPERLTERARFSPDGAARFSPDGAYIAFDVSGLPPNDTQGDIHVYSLEREQVIASLTGPSSDYLMGWLPTGARLLFRSDREGSDWFISSVDGETLAQPLPVVRDELPSGDSVGIENGSLYLNQMSSENDLYLVDYDPERSTFSRPARIGTGLPWQSTPAWSPGGDHFVYARNARGGFSLALRRFPGGSESHISLNMRRYHCVTPRWTSDGRSLVVGARTKDTAAGLAVVNVATEVVTPLVTANKEKGVVEWPTAAPKGIVYFVRQFDHSDKCKIVGRNIVTGEETTVHTWELRRPIKHLAVSADGKQLAFLERIDAEAGHSTLSSW